MRKIAFLPVIVFLVKELLFGISAMAAEIQVSSVADLQTSAASVNVGDVLKLTPLFAADLAGAGYATLSISHDRSFTIDGSQISSLGASSLEITQGGSGVITLDSLIFDGVGATTALTLNGSASVSYRLQDCQFVNRQATALKIGNSLTVDIVNTLFKDNHGNPGALDPGVGAKVTVTTSSFIGNWNSIRGGGAIILANGEAADRASFTLDQCYFYRNYSDSPAGQSMQGGAIFGAFLSYLDFTVKDCLFTENYRYQDASSLSGNADGGALAIRNSGGSDIRIEITGSTFVGNSAGDDGGAMLLEGAVDQKNDVKAYISNCTFTENRAGFNADGSEVARDNKEGGAIIFYGMLDSEITHCTFYANRANGGTTVAGGAVALDTGLSGSILDAPVLSNNIFIADTCDSNPVQGNVFLNPLANVGAAKNNGNVGYDNNEYTGYVQGQNITAGITVENVFANTIGTGTAAVPVREPVGTLVGAPGYTAQRFSYIPSPLTDEMYRDGIGPYYDPVVRSDVRGYQRDDFPNAGAVEIFWTKFDPNVVIDGTWVAGAIPTEAIRSLNSPDQFYLVTAPSPDNQVITFPRASINIVNPSNWSFQCWESNQPVTPGGSDYQRVDPATPVGSTKQTYTAIWLPNPADFLVDFDLQYEIDSVPQFGTPQRVVAGGTATKPVTDPVRIGYTFVNWYKEAACTNVWNFTTDTITEDTTIYAEWVPDSRGLGPELIPVNPHIRVFVK